MKGWVLSILLPFCTDNYFEDLEEIQSDCSHDAMVLKVVNLKQPGCCCGVNVRGYVKLSCAGEGPVEGVLWTWGNKLALFGEAPTPLHTAPIPSAPGLYFLLFPHVV